MASGAQLALLLHYRRRILQLRFRLIRTEVRRIYIADTLTLRVCEMIRLQRAKCDFQTLRTRTYGNRRHSNRRHKLLVVCLAW